MGQHSFGNLGVKVSFLSSSPLNLWV